MAINLRCSCGGETKLTAKRCPRCKKAFPQKGRKYKVTVHIAGKKISKTVSNLELAKEIENKFKMDIARGEFNLTRRSSPTLNQVWKAYLLWAKENKKSWKTDEYYYLKHLEPLLGAKHLDKISPFDIEKLMITMKREKSQRGRAYAPATIKHQVVLLSRLYSIARQWNMYDGPNPCQKVKLPKLNNKVTEFLSNEELSRLLKILENWPNKMSSAIVKFLLYTGLRRGEVFKLTWQDVDLKRKLVTLKDPKGKEDQTLPLSNKAVQVLNDVPKEYETPYIFYGKDGKQRTEFKTAWNSIKKAARLPDSFRLHGLRHHFASSLASSGVSLQVIQKLLTHKDASTTQRYAHLANKTLRDAVDLSDQLQEIQQPAEIYNLEEQNHA